MDFEWFVGSESFLVDGMSEAAAGANKGRTKGNNNYIRGVGSLSYGG
jgi:hypothetical protein